MKVDNAVIMAAGVSSRFAPLSYEIPKGLIVVKGEVLVERQIAQLMDAGVPDIYIITGYKAEKFRYLKDKFNIKLIYNADYLTRDNNASIWAAHDVLRNSYICSADNYFTENPFEREVDETYYAAVYADGHTDEWCMQEDRKGYIKSVSIGGEHAMTIAGEGKDPSLKDLLAVAGKAGLKDKRAREIADAVRETVEDRLTKYLKR